MCCVKSRTWQKKSVTRFTESSRTCSTGSENFLKSVCDVSENTCSSTSCGRRRSRRGRRFSSPADEAAWVPSSGAKRFLCSAARPFLRARDVSPVSIWFTKRCSACRASSGESSGDMRAMLSSLLPSADLAFPCRGAAPPLRLRSTRGCAELSTAPSPASSSTVRDPLSSALRETSFFTFFFFFLPDFFLGCFADVTLDARSSSAQSAAHAASAVAMAAHLTTIHASAEAPTP
mmetsp:Transcript_44499/g.139578  ORF Transcript_44499/g.139578 Transcript_44499/m.139578 type:complete len:233 (-) Transcript_44499:172-870(-)